MGPDVLRRIRWGNVGRLAGAAALLAAVVAWPRLAPPDPAMPGNAARPLDGLGAAPTATPPTELLLSRPPRFTRRSGRARRAGPTGRREGSGEAGAGGASSRRARRSGPRRRTADRAAPRPNPGSGAASNGGGMGGTGAGRTRGGDGEESRSGPGERGDGPAGIGGGDPAQTEFGFERR
jgi:hypothetical protein